jgi:hypothetical protein
MSDEFQARLREIFEYQDGQLIWKKRIGHRCCVGKPAGNDNGNGYKRVTIDGKAYFLHRLIWWYFNGKPPEMLDHIDGKSKNNRIENLRPTDKKSNGWNRGLTKANKSGYKGVTWNARKRKWVASITLQAGVFENIEDAVEAARRLREKLHGEFARHE